MADGDKLVLWQYRISPYCDKVRRILHVKGLDYRVEEVIISRGRKYRPISPTGKFPVLDDGPTRIVDSTDIAHHLEKKAPEPPLIPADPALAAEVHMIEDWADESLYFFDLVFRAKWPHNHALLVEDLLHAEKPGLMRRVIARAIPSAFMKIAKTQGLGRKSDDQLKLELERHAAAIAANAEAGAGWLVGEALSLADIAVVSMVCVIDRAAEGREIFDHYPALRAWQQRVDALTLPAGTDTAAA